MINDKIVSKIKKLMALGLGDPDSPEAKSAMDKVAKLMQEHGVAEVDLDKDGHVNTNSLVEEMVEVYDKHSDVWERSLAVCIAKAFDTKVLSLNRGRYGLPKRTFLGTKSDVSLSVYFYKFIRMQIRRGSEVNFNLIRDRKAYGIGCVIKVGDRLEQMYVKRQEVMTSDSKALILVKNDDVQKFFKERYPRVVKGKQQKITGSADAFQKGKADGSKIKMNAQVGNKSASGAVMIGA